MSHEARSEALIAVLDELTDADLEFVLVGGYAISQFEVRFSTDLDIVIAPDDHDAAVTFLEQRGFEREAEFEVDTDDTIYDREIQQFTLHEGVPHPVGVDLLVNGLGCRQTGAEWSFEYLREHSSTQRISGGTRSTTAPVADGELLIAAKLHSARKTDLADVLAAVPAIDFDAVAAHMDRGDETALRSQIQAAIEYIEDGGLDHRYKSMFGQSAASVDDVEALLAFLRA